MPKRQFLFSAVFGFRNPTQEIFSELDPRETEVNILPRRTRRAREGPEGGQGGPTPYLGAGPSLAAPPGGEATPWLLRLRPFAYILCPSQKPYHNQRYSTKSSVATAIAKTSFGGQNLCSGTPPGWGIAPGVISIDTTAIFIAIAVSHDEEGVVLPRG